MSSFIDDFRQGNTKTIRLDFGESTDITGWVFYFILKEKLDATRNVLKVEVTAGTDARDDVEHGLCYVAISATAVDAIKTGNYFWSLQVNKQGTPAVIETLLPPLEQHKDKVEVLPRMKIS